MIEMVEQPGFESPANSIHIDDERQTGSCNRENLINFEGAAQAHNRRRNYSEKAKTNGKHVKHVSDKV